MQHFLPSVFLPFALSTMRLDVLARQIGATVIGDLEIEVAGVASLDRAQAGEVTFVSDATPLGAGVESPAAALIVSPKLAVRDELEGRHLLVAPNPKLAFARAISLFYDKPYISLGVSNDLVTGSGSVLGSDCSVHPRVTIGKDCTIGDEVTLHPGVVIGDRVRIGARTVIFGNVSIYDDTEIGERCRIHSGTVIGSDGFSYIPDENGRQYKLLQVGRVIIEDDVEIGAVCCIDRAGFGETRIRSGAKFDNLIQIGHNCDIGENTVIAALGGFSGGTKIGRGCTIAGQIGTNPHVTVGDGAIITARTGITKSVEAGRLVGGNPVMDYQRWRRTQVLYARLPELFERIKKLEAKTPDAR